MCATCLSSAGYDLHQVRVRVRVEVRVGVWVEVGVTLTLTPTPTLTPTLTLTPQGSSGRGFTHVLMDEAAQASATSHPYPIPKTFAESQH